jgi:hypothetical protein
MELGWTALAALILAAAIAWFWQDSLAARERANQAAMEACRRLSLQFLDDTVAFSRLEFIRGTDSLFALRRTYVFDYTANSIERRQGFVVLTGRRVETVGYTRSEDDAPQPHAPAERVAQRAVEASHLPPSAKVLSLDEWRARQRSATGKASETRYNGTHAGD